MPHLLLIVEPVGQRAERTETEGLAAWNAMLAYTEALKQRGVLMASNALRGTESAVRLQVRDGQRRLSDGPFAEAKEMVGGFFLLDVETREQALAIAEECPAAAWCTVEVREVGPCYLR